MAFAVNPVTRDQAPGTIVQDPSKYSAIGDLLNAAAATGGTANNHGKPDVSELLVQAYGDQGITGFLKLTGAVTSAGASDQLEWYEAGRRHKLLTYTSAANITGANEINIPAANLSIDGTALSSSGTTDIEPGDVFMDDKTGVRIALKDYNVTASSDFTFIRLDGENASGTAEVDTSNGGTLIHLGNMYAQGTNQPSSFIEPDVKRYINSYAIVKDRFEVNGSQATNVGYINIGNGDYRWFMYGEAEARKRFEDRREMILLFGEKNDGSNTLAAADADGNNGNFAGTEGYLTAVEDRGIRVSEGPFTTLTQFDTLIAELDANGAPAEYAMYVNRDQALKIDDMLADQNSYGSGGQSYGAFDNNADMALQLGFKSFTRGGYTFHKHDWKLLNDPQLLGSGSTKFYKGVMTPLTTVADARTGVASPALEMKYKASNGYSREMEHWVTGGGVMGHTNGDLGRDAMVFHYRSEVALCTRAANQHVVITA